MGRKIPGPKVIDAYNSIISWEKKLKKKKETDYFEKPAQWIYGKIPDSARKFAEKTIEGMFGLLIFTSDYTFSDKALVRKISEQSGETINNVRDLQNQDFEHLVNTASACISQHNILGAMQGFGCGLGGAALIVADTPLIIGIAIRMIEQVGTVFGYDITRTEEKQFILNIIDISIASENMEDKINSMLDKEFLRNLYVDPSGKNDVEMHQEDVEQLAKEMLRVSGKEITHESIGTFSQKIAREMTQNMAKALAVKSSRVISRRVATRLTSRKLAQLIPVLGGVVGAGVNYWFVRQIGQTAFNAYLKRHIVDNYDV